LRREILDRAEQFVASRQLGSNVYRSLGKPPTVLFRQYEDGGRPRHGNFHPASYESIVRDEQWRQRLEKAHSQKSRSLRPANQAAAKELDSCTSSDALLMNVFCHPSAVENAALAKLFGCKHLPKPQFGFRARLPLSDGKREPRSTEIDLCFGTEERPKVLVEAKLTEGNFTACPKARIERYQSFDEVFDRDSLPTTADGYQHYQLLRNVLAAHAFGASFDLLCDQRRPDLVRAWDQVSKGIRLHGLRNRCRVVSWQKIAAVLDVGLQEFLEEKYGIV